VKKLLVIGLCTLIFQIVPLHKPYAAMDEESAKRQIDEGRNAINEFFEAQSGDNNGKQENSSTRSKSQVAGWPSTHGDNAVSATFANFDDPFKIYVWRESGYIWVEIDPQTFVPPSVPHICSSTYHVLQDTVLLDEIKLETVDGSSQCDDLDTRSVFRLKPYYFHAENPDWDQAFTLYYNSREQYQLDVPSASGELPANSCAATFGSSGFVHIPCFDSGGSRYWVDLNIYSVTPELLLNVKDIGIKTSP